MVQQKREQQARETAQNKRFSQQVEQLQRTGYGYGY